MGPLQNRNFRVWLGPLLIAIAVAAGYGNTLGLGFAWDDHSLILDNPRIADPDYPLELFFSDAPWRPLKRLTLALDYRLWGPQRPWGFHLTNGLLHLGASLLLFAVARRLGLGRPTATLVALLFALHPAHVEAVANITNRKESMALGFNLLGLLSWIALRQAEATRRLRRAALLLGVVAAYAGGLLSKEAGAVMMPALCLAWDLLFFRTEQRLSRRRLVAATTALGLLFALVLLAFIDSIPARFSATRVLWVTLDATDSYARLLLTSFKAVAFYVRLLLWPWPLYVDRHFTVASTAFEGGVVLGAVLVLALLGAAVATARRAPIASFGIAWLMIHLLPVLNLIPLTHWLVAERFLYGPSAGVALVCGTLFERLMRRVAVGTGSRLLHGGTAAVLVLYALVTARQNRVFENDATLWQHTVRHNPDSYLGWTGVADAHAQAGDAQEAESAYRRAIALRPDYDQPHYGLALLLYRAGNHADAQVEAKLYERARPYDPANLVLLGTLALEAGELEQATHYYGLARAHGDERPETHFNLANALYRSGHLDAALAALDRAPIATADAAQHFLRGRILQGLGASDDALTSYQRVAELSPTNPRPHTAMALILMRLGRRDEAAAALERSLAIFPHQPEALRVLEALRAERATMAP